MFLGTPGAPDTKGDVCEGDIDGDVMSCFASLSSEPFGLVLLVLFVSV